MLEAAILTIGDELLEGKLDTNSAWLGVELDRIGWRVREVRHCRDEVADIQRNLDELSTLCPLVITTGGLGPTTDDLTTLAVARWSGTVLALHEATWEQIQQRFAARGLDLPASNIKQAHYPAGATPLVNREGSAVGYLVEKDGRLVASFPGVPREMKRMVEEELFPLLRDRFPRDEYRAIRALRIFGHTESGVNKRLDGLVDGIAGAQIAYLVSFPEVRVFLKVNRADAVEADRVAAELAAEARRRLGDRVYGQDDDTLESVVGALLAKLELRLAVAESCTGGMIASRITDVAGSSAYFDEGVVTYSNAAKVRRLGITTELIESHGAVSDEVCAAMLEGLLTQTGADVGIAVTGIAGPGGGTSEKPVGLVYIAWGDLEGHDVRAFHFGSLKRDDIRKLAATTGLDLLRRFLLGRLGSAG
jgi:nicotinamide-nucleotide amidase